MKPTMCSIAAFLSAFCSRFAPHQCGLQGKLTRDFILCSLLTTFMSVAEAQLFVGSFASPATIETADPMPTSTVVDSDEQISAPTFQSVPRFTAPRFVGSISLDTSFAIDDVLMQVSKTVFVPNSAPVVTINGGNRTIADTDNVTGELVSFSGTATDTGGITSTQWLIDGAVVATGTSVALVLNDGTTVVSFKATDDDGASTTVSVTCTVITPVFQLPRTTGISSLQRASNSEFSVSVRDTNHFPVAIAPIAQALAINGFIFPQEADENFIADTFVVAVAPSGWFMRTPDGTFVRWSGNLADLLPAYENQRLTAQVRVPIYTGKLPYSGNYRFYVGYMRVDSSELIYMTNAGQLTITAP